MSHGHKRMSDSGEGGSFAGWFVGWFMVGLAAMMLICALFVHLANKKVERDRAARNQAYAAAQADR